MLYFIYCRAFLSFCWPTVSLLWKLSVWRKYELNLILLPPVLLCLPEKLCSFLSGQPVILLTITGDRGWCAGLRDTVVSLSLLKFSKWKHNLKAGQSAIYKKNRRYTFLQVSELLHSPIIEAYVLRQFGNPWTTGNHVTHEASIFGQPTCSKESSNTRQTLQNS